MGTRVCRVDPLVVYAVWMQQFPQALVPSLAVQSVPVASPDSLAHPVDQGEFDCTGFSHRKTPPIGGIAGTLHQDRLPVSPARPME